MKKIILLLTMLGVLVFHVSAQVKTEKIREFIRIMKTEELMNSMIDNMSTMMRSKIPGTGDKRKDSIFYAYMKEETIAFSKKIIEIDMPALYEKYFTADEIQKYIDFYKTPEGQKMINTLPALQKESMSNLMGKDLQEFQAKLTKKIEELKD